MDASHEPKHIFDLCFKRLLHLSSGAIVHFINGLFETDYPQDSTVTYPSTETITDSLKRVVSDIVIEINKKDRYLIEAQIGDDENMAVRIFQYTYLSGLKGAVADKEGVITITLPRAKVIYWETTAKTPEKFTLRIKSPNGDKLDYTVESFKFLEHSIHELEQKKMSILLPFYVLKLRNEVRKASTKQRLVLSAKVKAIIEELIIVTRQSADRGFMNVDDMRVVIGFIKYMYDDLYKSYQEFQEENTMVEELFRSDFEIAIEKEAEKRAVKLAEAKVEKLVEVRAEKLAEAKAEKLVEVRAEKLAEVKAEKLAEAKAEKLAEARAEKLAEVKAEKLAEKLVAEAMRAVTEASKVAAAEAATTEMKKAAKIARKLIGRGFDAAEVAEMTDLDIDTVQSLFASQTAAV
jgi:hypothetical protein